MLRITLDTNVIIEGMDGEKASVVERLKKLADEGKIHIALTTRFLADKDKDPEQSRKDQHLNEFGKYDVLGTVGRYGLSRYGQDFYA